MKRRELIQRLTKLATASAQEARRREDELVSIRGLARPGDLVVLPTRAAVIHWLIVKAHPEDPHLLFAIPGDDNPEAGPGDIHLPEEHPCGPITLRCSFGLWLDAELLDPPQRSGIMGEEVLSQVRAVLGQLAAGTLMPTPEQAVLDFDPDYLAWLGEVEKSRAAAASWLEAAGRICHLEEMETEPPVILRPFVNRIVPAEETGPKVLAAEGGGLRGRIAHRLAEASRVRWLHLEEGGNLYLAVSAEGVRAVCAGTARKPPRLKGREGNQFRPSRWTKEGDAFASEVWPWSEGRVVFLVGPGSGRRVVVRR